jgi:hypothetical protein
MIEGLNSRTIVRRYVGQAGSATLARPRIERSCRACRFGAGLPQGPKGLMRCVHPGEPTCGQFLRGPVACDGFQERESGSRSARVRTAASVIGAAVCGDCRYADLHALEAACQCTYPLYPMADPALHLRHSRASACPSFIARTGVDLVLHAPEHVPATAAR